MTPEGAGRQGPGATHTEQAKARELQALEAIAEAMGRQRAAILDRDTRSLNRLFEVLLALRAELAPVSGAAGGPCSGQEVAIAGSLAALARHVHEELAINQVLIRNGMAAADHYAGAAADASAAANQMLFSGVG